MRYAIPQVQRYDLAAKIGFFLVSKGLNSWDTWTGRLSKREQLDAFGFYMGKGAVTVDGHCDEITMTVKVCFGLDSSLEYYASARTGWLSLEGRRTAPILELNLYSSLNHFEVVAA